jgi:putative transposase
MLSLEDKRAMVEPTKYKISIQEQCSLINLNVSSYYYHPLGVTEEELEIMEKIDRIYTSYPFYGVRKITDELRRQGDLYNHKRIWRLMQLMGLQAIVPKKNLSKPNKESLIYPYLLRGIQISKTNQVWSSDITYLPFYKDYVFLVAVIDWFSRFVLSWELSNSPDVHFCIEALDRALKEGKPEIFNTDQGSQFTSKAFTEKVIGNKIMMSMDSKGRALDNIFIERFWRSLKYEDIYLKDYRSIQELREGLNNYFNFYNFKRSHQALKYKTPAEIYFN